MKTLNVEVPINSLSFGNVSVSLLKEFFKLKIDCNIFPIGNQIDLSAFTNLSNEFKLWLQDGCNRALKSYNSKDPVFKLWHIANSQNKISDKQFLMTFHETDALTETEVNILNNQAGILVCNNYNKEIFEKHGVKNVHVSQLGASTDDFYRLEKRLIPDKVISIGISGKFENRKRTAKVIQVLAKKYGNNPKYAIQLAVFNPFFSKEQNDGLIAQALGGKNYHNFNILPYTKTNAEYNQILNAIDIIIDMSGGESWSLPSFQSAFIGKHGIILNVTGQREWALDSGFVLLNPVGKSAVYDGTFFHPNQPFSQGGIYDFSEQDLVDGLNQAEDNFIKNKINEKGLELKNKFTWEKTACKILETIDNG